MELTQERIIITVVSATAIIALGLYFFLYRPLTIKLRTAYLECKSIENKAIQTRESIVPLKTTNTKRGLITEEDISLAIDELTRQGKLKGINFFSMVPKKIEKSEDFPCKILPIEMELESRYDNLGIFLGLMDDLEKSLVTVKSFNITPDKKDPRRLKTKLVINMYLLDANEE